MNVTETDNAIKKCIGIGGIACAAITILLESHHKYHNENQQHLDM